FFADGDDDALPSDHRAEAECERHSDFHPQWDKACGAVHVRFVVFEDRQVRGGKFRVAGLLDDAKGFTRDVHVVAEVAYVLTGYRRELLELRHFRADAIHELAQREHGAGLELPGTDEFSDFVARVTDGRGRSDVLVEHLRGLL